MSQARSSEDGYEKVADAAADLQGERRGAVRFGHGRSSEEWP
jgi:hypothetical protein